MNIEGKRLKVQPHTNRGGNASEFYIVGGDVVVVVANMSDWITVKRVSDGVIDTAPPHCFKYMNNKPVNL